MAGHSLHQYLIGLGSNRRHHRHGGPEGVLAAAVRAMTAAGLMVDRVSPVVGSAPLGPGGRRYANGAAIIVTSLEPPALLARLKAIEVAFGRRPGRRWGPRVLDLDIIAWCGGHWRSARLTVPHQEAHRRWFVLAPALALAPQWVVAARGGTVRQHHARLTRPRPARR